MAAGHPFEVDADSVSPESRTSFDKLLADRIVLVAGKIDDKTATLTIAQLLFLAHQDATAPICVYVNSPGGVVTSALGIYDTMLDVAPPVHTTCVGKAAGMAVLLLAAGEPGQRAAISEASMWWTALTGFTPDTDIATAEVARLHETLDACSRRHTGRSLQTLESAGRVDAAGALALGIVDRIIRHRSS
ncbi:ATP-dependent Clp protease proteolytic subunit [Enhygromyxa salina]|uniref:ATP-dependent Clp protease proteolytic subunit n=1 Tax=Enhygromyxa salina TaxID=215803 RepID=A0A0C2D8R4_9BACT|nr:ATP-dependent Clp protease proteolytic subunit [Enhygromyxa salina]KIG19476.1 ATP-dependent Clp protease proteolytic subunit [Enhygromyxa salina]